MQRSVHPASPPDASAARRRWAALAPAGLAAVGLGASLLGEATLKKGRGEAWFAAGTLALCVFNGGLCLFGEAVKQSTLAELGALQRRRDALGDV